MYVFYDGNVFEDGVVREWLDEVREAVLWYLGRTQQSHGGGGLGYVDTVQAKL